MNGLQPHIYIGFIAGYGNTFALLNIYRCIRPPKIIYGIRDILKITTCAAYNKSLLGRTLTRCAIIAHHPLYSARIISAIKRHA
jgi:hypothetical protein